MGLITLDMKQAGKPSAGKQHAGFDEAGAGNQLTVRIMRHSQRKRRDPARLNLRSMAPVLDTTASTDVPFARTFEERTLFVYGKNGTESVTVAREYRGDEDNRMNLRHLVLCESCNSP